MLILTRRIGEAIRIGGTIRLVVLAVQGMQVKFGSTPADVQVWQAEVYERVRGEQKPRKPG